MSVISTSAVRARFVRALTLGACLATTAIAPGCAIFGGGGPSLVAQGKYYSSGNARYDAFFIELYQLQLQMAGAPGVPEAERRTLAQALGLAPETAADSVTERLREEALKLARGGLRLRLEQNTAPENPAAASATLHPSFRPKETAATNLLATVEASATQLLRSAGTMKAAKARLPKLEVEIIELEADLPKAFAKANLGTEGEVKKNLADAQKLITLMKGRAEDVQNQSETLLAAVAKAVNTDDGSLSAPPPEATESKGSESKGSDGDAKKAQPKPHAKPRAASGAPTPSAPASAPKPKPPKTDAHNDAEPAKPAPPSKPAAPPRDFEP